VPREISLEADVFAENPWRLRSHFIAPNPCSWMDPGKRTLSDNTSTNHRC
jgi:hypothetical protein